MVYFVLLFLIHNIDCGYSLEPPRQGASNVCSYSICCKQQQEIVLFFFNEFFILSHSLCILHGRISVMVTISMLTYRSYFPVQVELSVLRFD